MTTVIVSLLVVMFGIMAGDILMGIYRARRNWQAIQVIDKQVKANLSTVKEIKGILDMRSELHRAMREIERA